MASNPQPSDQDFRPMVYLKLLSHPTDNTPFRLYTTISVPNNYTVVSSGFRSEGKDTYYTLYVQDKVTFALEPIPNTDENLELEYRTYSNQLNWRTVDFNSAHFEFGILHVSVMEITPDSEVEKGKNKVILADADDTDIKLIPSS